MKKYLLIGFLLLAGCTNPITVTPVVTDTPVVLPVPQPLSLADVNWTVLTKDNSQSFLADKKPHFVLDSDGYTNLQLNLNDIARYIQEQKTVIFTAQQILDNRSKKDLKKDKK